MATTSRPITELKLGIRDTSGAVVPSAKVRFYQPGTLIQQTVFADADCTTGLAQPVTCNAYGQATVYTKEAVRCIAKNAAETTTIYDGVINLNRADSVYMTVSGLNGGAETTVEEAFEDAVTSLGAGFMFSDNSASASAVDRNYVDRIRELCVSVKDYGAIGDDTTDDTAAITATITAANNRPIFFPVGTYKITSAINLTPSGNTRVRVFGAASGTTGASIIKNYGTTTNAFDINDPFGGEYAFSDIEISANTSTTGYAIRGQQGARLSVDRVTISGHQQGVDSTMNQTAVRATKVTLAATNGMGIKIASGTGGVIDSCYVTGPGSAGSSRGYEAGGNTLISGSFATALVTGFVAGASGVAGSVISCVAGSCVTGFSVGVSGCVVQGCRGYSNTTDLVAAAANDVVLQGNTFTTMSISSVKHSTVAMGNYVQTTSAVTPVTFTPDMSNYSTIQHFVGSHTAAAQSVTVANPTNTSLLMPGTLVILNMTKTGANALNITWGANWTDEDGSAFTGVAAVASNVAMGFMFVWTGSVMRRVMVGVNTAI